jgi:8-oxo-dGTP pyrophosphatase MutT (NUDIX family)
LEDNFRVACCGEFDDEAPIAIVDFDRLGYKLAMNSPIAKPRTRRKRGVVAVIFRDARLLVIRRAQRVTAPGKLCLPGGAIEKGETESGALVREMHEELTLDVQPTQLCYRSVTSWGTNLAWWHAEMGQQQQPVANPREVADVYWMSRSEVRAAKDLLPSLPPFLVAWERGEINLDCEWC